MERPGEAFFDLRTEEWKYSSNIEELNEYIDHILAEKAKLEQLNEKLHQLLDYMVDCHESGEFEKAVERKNKLTSDTPYKPTQTTKRCLKQ